VDIPFVFSMEDLVDAYNLLRARHRQHPQRRAIEYGENSRIHADAQSNRQDSDRRESRISPQHS
jgi:hypothetical protein